MYWTSTLAVPASRHGVQSMSQRWLKRHFQSRGPLTAESDIVRGTFETDPISALGLPSPVSIGTDATIGAALAAIQKQGQGYVLVVEGGRPRGIMTEREVLMKIVTRDVNYDSNVMDCVS